MEAEAVQCNELSSQGALLAVLPAIHAPEGSPHQSPTISPYPPGSNKLGYQAKQGYVMYQIAPHHGGHKCPVPNTVTSDRPVHHGANQIKFAQSLQSIPKE
ncbi:LOW QUALITY PROTEIN: hypothetical protein MC885_013832 [Smutsia gigantea]|nr:LOW QUALITY PROTEIN: hypothetical protein MC885_013832 [Smutsia gigantea]